MPETFLNTPADIRWLAETHAKGHDLTAFRSCLLEGNEDAPNRLSFWHDSNPDWRSAPCLIINLS